VNRYESTWSGATPLHALAKVRTPDSGTALVSGTGQIDSLTLMKLLLEAGANPNARLTKAPRFANLNDDHEIDIATDLGGATPFMIAAKGADVEAMRLLITHGADPKLNTVENGTPLMMATGIGYCEDHDQGVRTEDEVLEAAKLLIDLGVDVNATSLHGQTALHGAVYRAMNRVIQFLVENGANLGSKDDVGRTPLKLAEEGFYSMGFFGRSDQAEMLLKLGAPR
jgi:ankyrin repeat protein